MYIYDVDQERFCCVLVDLFHFVLFLLFLLYTLAWPFVFECFMPNFPPIPFPPIFFFFNSQPGGKIAHDDLLAFFKASRMVLDFDEIDLKSVIGSGAFATVFRGIYRYKIGRPGDGGGDKKIVSFPAAPYCTVFLLARFVFTGAVAFFHLVLGGCGELGRGKKEDSASFVLA